MSGILDSMKLLVTPALVAQIGQKLGMEPVMVEKGAELVLPMILGGVTRKIENPAGASDMMNLLGGDDGSIMTNLSSYVDQFAPGMGNELIERLFGDGFSTIQTTIEQQTGIDIGPLTAVLAPAVVSFLGNYMRTNNMNVAALSSSLRAEADSLVVSGGANAELLKTAMDNASAAQTLRTHFTTAEWKSLTLAPVAVAMLVIGSDPSGLSGVEKEINAINTTLNAEGSKATPGGLVNTLYAGGISTAEMDAKLIQLQEKPFATLEPTLFAELEQAKAIAKSKASEEELARFVDIQIKVADAVAAAAKEGGFLGFGGKLVSEKEAVMISRITDTLNAA